MFVYSIFDKKANVHRFPFFSSDDASAVRSVASAANDSRTDLCNYPYDFALYRVGEFNPDTGALSGVTPVIFVVEVGSLVKVDKNSES